MVSYFSFVSCLLTVISLLFSHTTGSFTEEQYVLNDNLINYINSQNVGWVASRNPRFEGITLAQARSLLGIKPTWTGVHRVSSELDTAPVSFDSRQQWPHCTTEIRNQEQCGSCWAFSATEVLQDRFCIATNTFTILSPQYVLNCDHTDMGCNGGYLDAVWNFLTHTGTTTDSCNPYVSGNGNVPSCSSKCANDSPLQLYKASGALQLKTVSAIQSDLMTNGPVQAAFSVYQDFFSYKSGVYVHRSGSLAGGHAIKIVGWGLDSTTNKPYWIVANSWGTSWGMNGYFWILRGVNECGIEDNVWSGKPVV